MIDDLETLAARLAAVGSPQRLRILAELATGPVHVSELARRVAMSRPVLYVHLSRLQDAGFVSSHHELSPDGKALKVFTIEQFELVLDLDRLLTAAAATPPTRPASTEHPATGPPSTEHPPTEHPPTDRP